MHTKLARFVIARGQYAAPLSRAANADWFAAQARLIAHFNGGVKAVHVQVDDRAARWVSLHTENVNEAGCVFA
jgi:ketosteroid isomerase-like protein